MINDPTLRWVGVKYGNRGVSKRGTWWCPFCAINHRGGNTLSLAGESRIEGTWLCNPWESCERSAEMLLILDVSGKNLVMIDLPNRRGGRATELCREQEIRESLMGAGLLPEDWEVYGFTFLMLNVSWVSAYCLLLPADRIQRDKGCDMPGGSVLGGLCKVNLMCPNISLLKRARHLLSGWMKKIVREPPDSW